MKQFTRLPAVLCVFLAAAAGSTAAAQEPTGRKPVGSVGVASPMIPGGAILASARIAVTPVAGSATVSLPLAADGSFRVNGLASGRYRLAVLSGPVGKQTQGATFGEKVNAGLHAAGSAVSQGASLHKLGIDGSMPNRISMNVSVGKQNHVVDIDGPGVEVDVAAGQALTGRVTPHQPQDL